MKKTSMAIAAVSLCSVLFLPIREAKAVPLPSPVEAVLDLVADIQQFLVSAGQIEEAIGLEMTTFDYSAGEALKMDVSALWGDFDPKDLIESSSMIKSALKGAYTEVSEWYSADIGLNLDSLDGTIDAIADIAETLYTIPENPTDDQVKEIKENIDDGIISAVSTAFGLSVSLTQQYKYKTEDFLQFDQSFLTSDDSSVAKYYAGLAKMNALLAISNLESAQISAKRTEATAVHNMYEHNI
jgi:hypothetical protein